MYKYKLILKEEEEYDRKQFQQERIKAFDEIETRLEGLKKAVRQGKIETIKYYRENPESYNVVLGTDIITDYIKDIEILLKGEE